LLYELLSDSCFGNFHECRKEFVKAMSKSSSPDDPVNLPEDVLEKLNMRPRDIPIQNITFIAAATSALRSIGQNTDRSSK
jgi:7-cyano-7-deazaguanine synthase in queuosine biosynthesis